MPAPAPATAQPAPVQPIPTLLHDRLCAGLSALGYKLVKKPSTSKYTVYQSPVNPRVKLFVGSCGALRAGQNVTESRAVPDGLRARVLAAAIPRSMSLEVL